VDGQLAGLDRAAQVDVEADPGPGAQEHVRGEQPHRARPAADRLGQGEVGVGEQVVGAGHVAGE
jgi:hypothetical protein